MSINVFKRGSFFNVLFHKQLSCWLISLLPFLVWVLSTALCCSVRALLSAFCVFTVSGRLFSKNHEHLIRSPENVDFFVRRLAKK